MSLVAYFSVPAQALSSGTANIPSSRVEARMTTGAIPTFTPITGNGVSVVGTPGGSVVLWTNNCFATSNAASCRRASRTDQLDLRLNLTGAHTVAGPPARSHSGPSLIQPPAMARTSRRIS
jgi:hypothetical protein